MSNGWRDDSFVIGELGRSDCPLVSDELGTKLRT